MPVISISALGNYRSYKPVFYRVYIPGTSRNSRASFIVATPYASLAPLSANLYDSNDNFFIQVIYVPITLLTIIINKNYQNNISNNIKIFIFRLIKDYIKTMQSKYIIINEYIKKKNSKNNILIPEIEYSSIHYIYEVDEKIDNYLPIYIILNSSIKINNKEYNGYTIFVVIPNTGYYSNFIFRESTGADIKKFGSAVVGAIIDSIRFVLRNYLNKYNNVNLGDAKIIIDTTHGINTIVSQMYFAIKYSEPLIIYETKRMINRNDIKILYYNSDAFLISSNNDNDFLEKTYNNQISYYYNTYPETSLYTVTSIIEHEIIKDKNIEDENLINILKGIYLIKRGLLLWGLYYINNNKLYKNEYNIKIEIKSSNIYNINYNIYNKELASVAYALAYWLSLLTSEAVDNLITKIKLNDNVHNICWDNFNNNVLCFDLNKIKEFIKNKANDWYEELILSLIHDTAKIIIENELNKFLSYKGSEISNILKYMVPTIFDIDRNSQRNSCSEILGGYNDSDERYCFVPSKIQPDIRNIIAHAGFISVHRFIGFILNNDNENATKKCRFSGVCIGKGFPDELFDNLFDKLNP